MAFQVRLDLTPAEFDLLRRALDSYRHAQFQFSKPENKDAAMGERRKAGQEAVLANTLLQRMQ